VKKSKNYIDDKKFIDEQNTRLEPMGAQLNSLLTHPVCTKDECFCGKKSCYYSTLWKNKN
jgi:hypothetical protein